MKIKLGLKVQNNRVYPFSFVYDFPDKSYNDSVLILGGSGLGKTRFAELLIYKREIRPCFIFDPKGDFLRISKNWYASEDTIKVLNLKKELFTPVKFRYSDITENFLFEILRLKKERQYSMIISNYFGEYRKFEIGTFKEYLIRCLENIKDSNKKRSYTVLLDSLPVLVRSSLLSDKNYLDIEDFFTLGGIHVFYFPLDSIDKYLSATLLLEKILSYSIRNSCYPMIVFDELSLWIQNDYLNEIMKLCVNAGRGYRAYIGITQNINDLPPYFCNRDNFLFFAEFLKHRNIPRRLVSIDGDFCLVERV